MTKESMSLVCFSNRLGYDISQLCLSPLFLTYIAMLCVRLFSGPQVLRLRTAKTFTGSLREGFQGQRSWKPREVTNTRGDPELQMMPLPI